MAPRLKEKYDTTVCPALKESLSCGRMAIPKLKKIVISMGMGDGSVEKTKFETAHKQLSLIAGQKPIIMKAKKSVSNFKLREGYEIGAKVTLRGRRMYEFVDRLFNLAVPRMRDFRGLSTSAFDGRGNYSMGVSDQTIFPEINIDKIEYRQGMNITFVTSAEKDSDAMRLLALMGMPFKRAEGGK